MGLDEINLTVDITFRNYFVVHADLKMSFSQSVCDPITRRELCNGISQSLAAIPLDRDVASKLRDMLECGTPVQQIYLIIFAIVRLAGLYEIVAEKSNAREIETMKSLYYVLNEHLMGEKEEGTDAYAFVRNIVVMADYLQ